MRRIVDFGARMAFVLALLYLHAKQLLPGWLIYAGIIAGAAYLSPEFIRAFHAPPSVNRLYVLFLSGSVIVGALLMGALGLLFETGIINDTRAIIVAMLTFAVSAGACIIWYRTAAQSFGRWKPKDPDFAEEADGNPERSRQP